MSTDERDQRDEYQQAKVDADRSERLRAARSGFPNNRAGRRAASRAARKVRR